MLLNSLMIFTDGFLLRSYAGEWLVFKQCNRFDPWSLKNARLPFCLSFLMHNFDDFNFMFKKALYFVQKLLIILNLDRLVVSSEVVQRPHRIRSCHWKCQINHKSIVLDSTIGLDWLSIKLNPPCFFSSLHFSCSLSSSSSCSVAIQIEVNVQRIVYCVVHSTELVHSFQTRALQKHLSK